MAFPDENLLQCWNLEHLTSDGGLRPSPINGRLKALAMGSDSDGPVLAHWNPSKRSSVPERFSFIELNTLQVLKIGTVSGPDCRVSPSRGTFSIGGESWDLRASPGGNLFGLWGGYTNGQIATLSIRGARLGEHSQSFHMCGFLAPGADGVTFFTGSQGRIDAFGDAIVGPPDPDPGPHAWTVGRPWGLLTVPSASADYFLVPGPGLASVSIHSAGDGARLLTIPTLAEMTTPSARDPSPPGITAEKRFHFLPAVKLLITIPPSNDRLVLRRVDIDAAVGQTADAILILTPPLLNARAGQPLVARIQAKSTKGDVQFTLVKGPKGLSISPDGQISWAVPDVPDGGAAKIVLSLRDPAGRSRSHEVAIRVQ